MGRKPLPDDQRRTKSITVNFTAAEEDALKRIAEANALSTGETIALAELVRSMALADKRMRRAMAMTR